jgi:hypothetical protein
MGLHKFGIQETLRSLQEEPELTAEEIEVLAQTRRLCEEKDVDLNRLIEKLSRMSNP